MPQTIGGPGMPVAPRSGVSYRGANVYGVQRQAPSVYSNQLPARSTVISSPSRSLPTIQSPATTGIYTRGTASGSLTATQPSVLVPGGTSTGSGGSSTSVIPGTRPLPSVARPTGSTQILSPTTPSATTVTPTTGLTRPVGSNGPTNIVPPYPGRYQQQQTNGMSPYQQPQYAARAPTTGCTTSGNGIFGFFEATIGAVVRSVFGISTLSACSVATTTGTTATTATTGAPVTYAARGMTLPAYGSQLPVYGTTGTTTYGATRSVVPQIVRPGGVR